MSDSATPPARLNPAQPAEPAASGLEHDVPGPVPVLPPPLLDTGPAPRRTPAEEARALVASTNVATLATHSSDGYPWASLVAFGSLGAAGSPVLFVSRLAEHARNLERDGRASLVVADPNPGPDVLAAGRVTLAGTAARPAPELADMARDAYVAAVPSAKAYLAFRDFSLWILSVERVRWVGGYGRMDSVDAESYAAAETDPVARAAGAAKAHLNDDHADALLVMAQALGGYPDATAATCTSIDRYGLDLELDTPRGPAATRVGFAERVTAADGLRAATVELVRRARGG
jgi:putative heme iron utilization protein